MNGVNGGDTVFVRLCVCARAQRTSQPDQFKTVTATDLTCLFLWDSPDMTPKNFRKVDVARVT